RDRASAAEAALNTVQSEVGAMDEGELGLDARHGSAAAPAEAMEARLRELADAEREAERERTTWTARAEALAMGLTRKDGGGALLAAGMELPGVRGSLASLITVRAGYEVAVAAALGAAADAIAVATLEDAVQGINHLKA